MKKTAILTLILALCLVLSAAASQVNPSNAAYEDFGTVVADKRTKTGVVLEAEGYFGYHMEENPSMTLRVEIGKDGLIKLAEVVASKAQTPGFDTQITQEYLNQAYVGQAASPQMEVDAVTGATATSQAVLYAVRTAANYAWKTYGYSADQDGSNIADLNAVYPASYSPIPTQYQPDEKNAGTILFAAEGKAEDGTQVVAMKVRSALKFSYTGSAGTGWTASEPGAFTMVIVVDKATNRVDTWSILRDGTKRAQYFKVPDEKIDAYKGVAIDREDVFDQFMDGLVLALEYETVSSEDGPLITGTSIVYTGATEQGTFSSQLVRNCFKAAAAFYVNYQK